MAPRKFSFRTFTSLILAWSFSALIVSGAVLYVAPPGRIANWTRWQLVLLTKEQWQAVHTLSAITFLIAGLFHLLKFNWKAFLAYIRRRAEAGLTFRREILASSVLFFAIVAGTIANQPPFATVMTEGEAVRESWEDPSRTAPVPHMEEITLRELAGRMQVEPQKLSEVLRGLGYSAAEPDESLEQIAERYRKSPSEIYTALSNLDPAAPQSLPPSGAGAGRGQGFKTLAETASECGLTVEEAVLKLAARGIEAGGGEKMRDIADRSKMKPYELLEILKCNPAR